MTSMEGNIGHGAHLIGSQGVQSRGDVDLIDESTQMEWKIT